MYFRTEKMFGTKSSRRACRVISAQEVKHIIRDYLHDTFQYKLNTQRIKRYWSCDVALQRGLRIFVRIRNIIYKIKPKGWKIALHLLHLKSAFYFSRSHCTSKYVYIYTIILTKICLLTRRTSNRKELTMQTITYYKHVYIYLYVGSTILRSLSTLRPT